MPITREQSHLAYVLRLADTALILGQRNSEWCGHGPALEEDIALANLSLDLIGQARLLYGRAAALEAQAGNAARSEDDYAYFRDEGGFTNYTLAELPHHGPLSGTAAAQRDYAVTTVRNFLYATLMELVWQALETSSDPDLAAIAVKSGKETRYHVHHAHDWLVRMGDGTDESHRRTQAALDYLLPYTREFFSIDPVEQNIADAGIGPLTADLRPAWTASLDAALAEATLPVPRGAAPAAPAAPATAATATIAATPSGGAAGAGSASGAPPVEQGYVSTGKFGAHSEHLGFLLAEMQSLARAHPGATW